MDRCGVAKHPRDWKWTGYHEIMGLKKRNRLLDLKKLMELFGGADPIEFRANYEQLILERISKDEMKRQAYWTEAIAVGSRSFVNEVHGLVKNRKETFESQSADDTWLLKEEPVGYGNVFASENRVINIFLISNRKK